MKENRYLIAFKRFINQLEEISVNNNVAKLYLLFSAAICFIIYGSTPNDYVHYEFYKKNHNERKKFITHRKTLKLDKILNDDRNMKYFDDKVLFNRKFKDFVKRDWIYLPDSNYDEFRNIVIKHETVMVKPIDMSSGKGIETYTYIDDERLREFYESIKNRNLLIEEKVTNHKEISVLNPSCANTIRVYTIVGKDGCVSIISAIIRIGSSGSCVDNYHSGGVASAIDINTGIIYTVPVDVNGRRHILHPSTHKEIIGKKIPMWDELIKNVTAAAKIFPTSRYIGWDICITDYGIEFIEGNYHSDPGLLQSADQVGKYYIVKNLI